HGTKRRVKRKAHIFEGLAYVLTPIASLGLANLRTDQKHGKVAVRFVKDVLTTNGVRRSGVVIFSHRATH
ncbi:MAG: hypothetical protein ABI450_00750, partial [Rhizomicrobium sp.]